jgi:hypothetical protein
MVKMTGKTQAQVDAANLIKQQEAEMEDAKSHILNKQPIAFKLILKMMEIMWPTLTQNQKTAFRVIIPDEMETEIRGYLDKL